MAGQLPIPVPDGDTRVFWEGVQKGELLIQECGDCHKSIFYPRSICPHCFSDEISWVKSEGVGHIYSFTIVHQAYGPFADQTPFAAAIVELKEGVRMMTRIVNADLQEISIDAPVRVVFEKVDDELTLPYFELVRD